MFYCPSVSLRSLRVMAVLILLFSCAAAGHAQVEPKFHDNAALDPRLANFKDYRYQQHPLDEINNLTSAPNGTPTAGGLDTSFNSEIFSAPGNARVTAVQPDGKILVGGYFRTLNGVRRDSLVRLNADNTIDSSFVARVNSTVLSIAVQPDGKIVIGGVFTAVNGVGRKSIARLNADGSLDTTFSAGTGADNLVYDIVVQPDGKIVIGGNFLTVNGMASCAVARLNADGSLDSSFASQIPAPSPFPTFPGGQPHLPSAAFGLVVQPDGKIVLGGFIVRSYEPSLNFSFVARLNSNGSFDSSFNPANFNSNPFNIALQADGKILAGGFFNTVGGVSRNRIARLNADGSHDETFNPGTGADLPVYSISPQANGTILIGGSFRNFNGAPRTGAARLNADGSLDTTFGNPGVPLLNVYDFTPVANGKIIVAGSGLGINQPQRDTIFVLNADGSVDTSAGYSSTALGGVRTVVAQPDGKVLVGGFFKSVNGLPRNGIARLNPDGSPDQAFQPTLVSSSSFVSSIALQPDGKILAAGNVTGSSTSSNLRIARYNADGTLDNSFVQAELPPESNGVKDFVLRPNGKILLTYYIPGFSREVQYHRIARLNNDGSLDSSFNSTFSTVVEAIAVQPDEKILLGGPGGFCEVGPGGSTCYNGVYRLNSDGTFDATFRTNFAADFGRFSRVYTLAIQPDGRILAGGGIYPGSSTVPTGVVRLNQSGTIDGSFDSGSISNSFELARVEDIQLLPNGKMVIGGLFNNLNGTAQNNVARLNTNGSLDTALQAATDNTVYDVAVQANGKILLGGDFETVNNTPRTVVARLLSEPVNVRSTLFDFDGDGKADIGVVRQGNWFVQRSSQGFFGTQFGNPTDKITPADFDGDGKTDVAVFRDGNWFLQRSTQGFASIQFGQAGDVPQSGDFDGDGKADLAVFRNGNWYILNSAGSPAVTSIAFGQAGDVPVAADYDGDGKADVAVFRGGSWYVLRSSNSSVLSTQFGQTGDVPVAADYDGDNKTDFAVFRGGSWYVLGTTQGYYGVQFGIATDKPVPADYDGDGKSDIAVFRDGNWYLQRSAQGFTAVPFGIANDIPISGAYLP